MHPSLRIKSFITLRAITVVAAVLMLIASFILSSWNSPLLAKHNQQFVGSSWSIVPSPNIGYDDHLFSVAAVSANDIWAVGYYFKPGVANKTLIEHWNSTSWSVVPSPNPSTSSNYLNGVGVVSANDIWTVGYYCNDPYCNVVQTVTEHWDGSQWSVIPSPNPGSISNFLYGVAAVSASNVWAVGYYDGGMLTEQWNGTKWSVVPSGSAGLEGVVALNSNDIWAVGGINNKTVTEHWDGTAWNVVTSPSNGALSGVAAISTSDVWAMGSYSNNGSYYQTLIEHWDGTAWNVVTSPSNGALSGVAAISTSDVWAVGYHQGNSAQTLTEHWDGTQWSVVSSPNVGSSDSLEGVAAISASDVWTVGNYQNNNGIYQTLIEHYTASSTPTPSPTPPPRGKLFVLIQGIDTQLKSPNTDDTFWPTRNNVPGIAPFLQNKGYSNAKFLEYSYAGYKNNGEPKNYSCLETFRTPLLTDIQNLGGQIVSAIKNNPHTDIYLVGHSLGGVIALGYEIALLKTSGIVPPLPSDASLKGVITLDSPIGGVTDDPNYLSILVSYYIFKCLGLHGNEFLSVKNLISIYQSAPSPHPHVYQGGNASILQAILNGQALSNQFVAGYGVSHGISGNPIYTLTIGNTNDLSWRPSICDPGISDFMSTQWVEDIGDNSGVYGRDFTDGPTDCPHGLWNALNHLKVLNNTTVEQGLLQFLPNGGTPSALMVAPPGP